MKNILADKTKARPFIEIRIAFLFILLFGIFSCSKISPIEKSGEQSGVPTHELSKLTSRASNEELSAFRTTLYPILSRRCSGCHNSLSPIPAAPFFADDNMTTAFSETLSNNIVRMVSPADSPVVMKVQSKFHYCWSGTTPDACFQDALTLTSAAEKWSDMRAPILTVNSANDIGDAVPGDGVCKSPQDTCSLRAAIQEANMSPVPVTINLSPTLTAFDLTISGLDNTSERGDLDILKSMRIKGVGADKQEIRVNNINAVEFGIFHVSQSSQAETFVKIEDVTIRNGMAKNGAGIYIESGALVLDRVVVENNRTPAGGAGAGIYQNSGFLALRNSTVSNNGIDGVGGGGGVFISENAIVTMIVNSTVSGNSTKGGLGAGIYNASQFLEVSNATIANNIIVGLNGRGGGLYNAGVTKIKNSLVAANYALPNTASDCSGSFISGGYNLVSVINDCFGIDLVTDKVGTVSSPLNPFIGVLADNGGPTPTHALEGGDSGAFNTGDPVSCSDFHNFQFTSDQRGVPRPARFGNQTPICDRGSFEFGPKTIPPVTPDVVAQDMSIESDLNSRVSGTLGAYNATNHRHINFVVMEKPLKGELTLGPSSGVFTYKPGIDKVGIDSFTFVARTANNGVSLQAQVDINILNRVPVTFSPPVAPKLFVKVRQGKKIRGKLPTYDLNGDLLVFTPVKNQATSKGMYSVESPLGVATLQTGTAVFEYVPNPTSLGGDSFEFAVRDGVFPVIGLVEVDIIE